MFEDFDMVFEPKQLTDEDIYRIIIKACEMQVAKKVEETNSPLSEKTIVVRCPACGRKFGEYAHGSPYQIGKGKIVLPGHCSCGQKICW